MFHGKKYVFTKPTDVDMLLMLEKGIRGETCYTINRYSEHERDHASTEFSYFIYWDIKKLYGWLMSQRLFVNDIE